MYTESDLQRLKFIRHARQLGFSLESIRELLSIRIDPEHHTCQSQRHCAGKIAGSRSTDSRVAEYAAFLATLNNDACCGTAHSSVYCSILEALEQGRVALRVAVDFLH